MGFMTNELVQNTINLTKVGLLHDAEKGLDTTANDIRLSSNADDNNRWPDQYAPDPNNQYSWQSNGTTAILATAATDIHGNILWVDKNNYIPYLNNIIYFVQSGTLYKRILAAQVSGNAALTTCPAGHTSQSCPADGIIASNVTSFSVAYHDGNDNNVDPASSSSIILQITLSQNSFNQPISASYTERMVFRNG